MEGLAMTTYLPRFVPQLDGSPYQGLNCTCAVGAMAVDRETLGAKTTTGARVRQMTHDTSGGTTQRQVVNAVNANFDTGLELALNISTNDALKRLDSGEGMMLAGRSSVTRGTRWQESETFGGNHQWWDNERRRNSQAAGGWEHRIYGPLGDGRRAGIANFAPHGLWIPQAVVLDFAHRLNVSTDPDHSYVPLGYGKLYAAFTQDTEPHLELHWGGHPIVPPKAMYIKVPTGQRANKRTRPNLTGRVVDQMRNGERFNAYQKTIKGQNLGGSSVWYGNVDGTRWLHSSAF